MAAFPIVVVDFAVSDFSDIGRPSLNSVADVLPGARGEAGRREVSVHQKVLIGISAPNHHIADSDSVRIAITDSLESNAVLSVFEINANLSMSDSLVTAVS